MSLVTRPIRATGNFAFDSAQSVKLSFADVVDMMQADADRFNGAVVWSELSVDISVEGVDDVSLLGEAATHYYGSVTLETQVVIGGKEDARA